MFKKGSRYVTKTINIELPFKLHIILWLLIDELINDKSFKVDYLQVFNIYRVYNGIKIIHTQEVPPYKNEIFINRTDIILSAKHYKIFVIDSVEYSTMMFSNEY